LNQTAIKKILLTTNADSDSEAISRSLKERRLRSRRELILGTLLATVSFLIFLYNLCPTVYFWDSAELSTASAMLGIPHSPGFAIYIMWGRLFSLLPFGDLGYRLNLFSAVCGAVSIFVLFLILSNLVSRLEGKARLAVSGLEFIAAALILLFAFSFSSLTQATRAEVYYPNLLLLSLAIYFTSRPCKDQQQRIRSVLLSFFIIGLGAGLHHLTVFLTLPGIIILSGIKISGKLSRTVFLSICVLLLGATVLLFLPLRFLGGSQYFWGDPSTFGGFWRIFIAADFWKSSGVAIFDHLIQLVSFALTVFYRQWGPVGILGALAGFVFLLRNDKRLGTGLFSMLALNILSIFFFEDYFYAYLDIHGYLLLSNAILAMVGAIGWIFIISRILARIGLSEKGRIKQYAIVSSLILLLLVIITSDSLTYSLRKYYGAKILAEKLCEPLSGESLVVCSSMNSKFLLDYQKYLDPKLSDVEMIDFGSIDRNWYRKRQLSRLIGPTMEQIDLGEIVGKLAAKYGKNLFVEFSPALGFLSDKLTPSGILFRYSDKKSLMGMKADYEIFPRGDGDIELTRFYLEWLLGLGTYYKFRGDNVAADSCFKIIINIDPTSSDIINEDTTNVNDGD